MSLAQLAIAWLLQRDAVTSVIIGATKVAQIEENAASTKFKLSDKDLAQIDELFPAE